MKEQKQAIRNKLNKNTQIYMENPRREKPQVEEKKNLLSQKLVREERDASDYYIGINIITLNPIHHCIYIYIYIYIYPFTTTTNPKKIS